jgi:hypothetical protein
MPSVNPVPRESGWVDRSEQETLALRYFSGTASSGEAMDNVREEAISPDPRIGEVRPVDFRSHGRSGRLAESGFAIHYQAR